MATERTELETEAALTAERQFVLSLGGFAVEVAGAALVTHEKVPVPRFNFVQEVGVGPERQTAFFERALDHYFQRALRPTFRVPVPVGTHLDAGLRRFGFRPRTAPLVLLLDASEPTSLPRAPIEVRPARRDELDVLVAFWTGERERPEFRSAVDVVWHHPNPHEQLLPLLAFAAGEPVASALVYRYRSAAGIHAVATKPSARGQGAASELVRYVRERDPVGPAVRYAIFSDSDRLTARLKRLGFRPARAFAEYILPHDAALAVPQPGPPGPPRWRPPRARG